MRRGYHHNGESPRGSQCGETIVGNSNCNSIRAGCLRHRRRPAESATTRINGSAARRAGIDAVIQSLQRLIRINPFRGETQRAARIHCCIEIADSTGVAFGMVLVRISMPLLLAWSMMEVYCRLICPLVSATALKRLINGYSARPFQRQYQSCLILVFH